MTKLTRIKKKLQELYWSPLLLKCELGPRQSYCKALCLYVVILILFQTGRWTKSKQRMIQNQLQAFERKVFAEIFGEQFRASRSDAFLNRTPTDDMWQDALRLTGQKEYT